MAWTDITDAAVAVNGFVTEDTFTDLCDNADYNYDHGVRCGTDGTGVRLALARGRKYFERRHVTMPGETMSNYLYPRFNIMFATDSEDGNPNFLSAPLVWAILEEEGYDAMPRAWYDGTTRIEHQGTCSGGLLTHLGVIPSDEWIGITKDGFTFAALFYYPYTEKMGGWVNWFAIGAVATGE